jgi:hypothetical protein
VNQEVVDVDDDVQVVQEYSFHEALKRCGATQKPIGDVIN